MSRVLQLLRHARTNSERWRVAQVVRRLAALINKQDLIGLRLLDSSNALQFRSMTGTLLIGCSTLHSLDEFKKLSDPVAFPTADESDITGGQLIEELTLYSLRSLTAPVLTMSRL